MGRPAGRVCLELSSGADAVAAGGIRRESWSLLRNLALVLRTLVALSQNGLAAEIRDLVNQLGLGRFSTPMRRRDRASGGVRRSRTVQILRAPRQRLALYGFFPRVPMRLRISAGSDETGSEHVPPIPRTPEPTARG